MNRLIFLISVLIAFSTPSYGSSGITMVDALICNGESANLSNLASNISPGTIIEGWFLQGVKIQNLQVNPTKTTTYELRTSLNGLSSVDYATVQVRDKPKIVVMATDTVCEGDLFVFSVISKENADFISFRDQSNGALYSEKQTIVPVKNMNIEVSATNAACPGSPDIKNISIRFLKKNDPDLLKIESDILGSICESCKINLNEYLRENLKYNGDSINEYTFTWTNVPDPSVVEIPRTPYQSVNYFALVNAIVYAKNDCGLSIKTFTNYMVRVSLEIKACLPYLSASTEPNPVCNCDKVELTLTNPNMQECNFDEHSITFSTTQGELPVFIKKLIGNNAQYFIYDALVKNDPLYTASVNYQLSCPIAEEKKQIKVRKAFSTQDCPPNFYYQYCKGDTAYFQISRSSQRQTLKNIEIKGRHKDLFAPVSHTDQLVIFASKDTVMDSTLYSPIVYSCQYYDANCDTVFEKTDSLFIYEQNCKPTSLLKYPPHSEAQGYACKGDTIRFAIEEFGRAVYIDSVVFVSDAAYSVRFVNKEENVSNLGTTKYLYEIYAYKSFNLNVRVYFNEAGRDTNLLIAQRIIISSSCGASLAPLVGDNACHGSTIEATIILQNPTSRLSKPLDEAIKWNNDPPVEMEYLRYESFPPLQYYHYKTKVPPQKRTEFKVTVAYNQGDSLYETEYKRMANTLECRPLVSSSDYVLCRGEEMIFTVKTTNPHDSIFSITWDSIPNHSIRLAQTDFKTTFDFKTLAYKDTTYRVKIRVYNHDSIREYFDSISVIIHPKPRAFTREKIAICRGTQVDLRAYENRQPNEGGVRNIFYPGNNSIFDRYHSSMFIVQAESEHLCKWMNGNRIYWDSIFVQVDSTLWATVMGDTTVCQYSRIRLRGNSNGLLTWVKNGRVLYEKIAVDSVVYDIIDTISNYEIHFENACESTQRNLRIDIIDAPLLKVLPYDEICIFDTISLSLIAHDCRPESLYWTYTHDSLPSEQKINAPTINMPLNYSDTTYFYVHGMGYNNCPMQSLCKVMVYPLPKVGLSMNGDSVLCARGETQLSLNATGAQSYYFPQFNCSTCVDIRTKVDTTTLYTVKGTDIHGCANEGRFYFIVNQNVLPFTDTGFCDRQSFSLCADSLENAHYAWFSPTDTLLSDRREVYIANAAYKDTGVYTLYSSRFICKDTNHVRLYLKPTPMVRVEENNAPLCEGSDLRLRASGDRANAQYYWLLNDSTPYTTSLEYAKSAVHLDDSGCYRFVGSLNLCADTLTVYVRVDAHTSPNFVSADAYYCEGDSVYLMAQPVHADIQYIWKTAVREFQTAQNIFVIPSIQLKENAALCLSVQKYTCMDSICLPLEVRMRPNPSIVADSFYCEGEDVFITAIDTIVGGFSQWEYQGNPLFNSASFEYPNVLLSNSGLYIFKQMFNGCESRPDSLQLRVRPLPLIKLGNLDYVCETHSLLLDVERAGGTYLWSTGDNSPSIWVSDSAWYWVEVTENECRLRDSIYIYLRPTPFVNLGNDSIICNGDVVILKAPEEAETYLWQDQSRRSEFEVSKEGLYWLQAYLNGCSHTDSIYFLYKYCGQFFLPNAFTPNGDQRNDEFKVILNANKDEIDFSLWIYDRNGKLMFETKDFNKGWDGYYKGRLCASGVYVCKVQIIDKVYKETYTKTSSLNLLY